MKQLHPTRAVPVLQMDNKVLYESIVCAQYLDDLSPNFKFDALRFVPESSSIDTHVRME